MGHSRISNVHFYISISDTRIELQYHIKNSFFVVLHSFFLLLFCFLFSVYCTVFLSFPLSFTPSTIYYLLSIIHSHNLARPPSGSRSHLAFYLSPFDLFLFCVHFAYPWGTLIYIQAVITFSQSLSLCVHLFYLSVPGDTRLAQSKTHPSARSIYLHSPQVPFPKS